MKNPKKRGISKNQVAVMCALDRSGNIISELICNGRMKYKDVERLFKDRIEENQHCVQNSHKVIFVQIVTLTQIYKNRNWKV